MSVSEIESTHFTHLLCAFADLNNVTYEVTVSPSKAPVFSTFTQTVQQKNPSIKTLLSIGGGSAKKTDYALMAENPDSRKALIDSSIRLARSNGFFGLDLDWEYPETEQMTNFGLLIGEWREAVKAESRSSGMPQLLLAAAVYVSPQHYSGARYPIQAIANSLDWVNVMAYDFYGPGWSKVTGHPAALRDPAGQVSGDKGVKEWIQAGLPEKKIVLGFPFYGWAWRLVDTNNNGYYAPADGAAKSEYSDGHGAVAYKRIKAFISDNDATHVYNETVVGAYCYSGTTWIGYDDDQTIAAKVSYAKDNRLLGYFAWRLDQDDNWDLSSLASRTWGAQRPVA